MFSTYLSNATSLTHKYPDFPTFRPIATVLHKNIIYTKRAEGFVQTHGCTRVLIFIKALACTIFTLGLAYCFCQEIRKNFLGNRYITVYLAAEPQRRLSQETTTSQLTATDKSLKVPTQDETIPTKREPLKVAITGGSTSKPLTMEGLPLKIMIANAVDETHLFPGSIAKIIGEYAEEIDEKRLHEVIKEAPPFNGYKLEVDEGFGRENIILTSPTVGPHNLFISALSQKTLKTTMPGSGKLYAFTTPQETVIDFFESLKAHPDRVVEFNAVGKQGNATSSSNRSVVFENIALDRIYGTHTFRMTHNEVTELLKSQQIFLSPLIPRPFYLGLKKAMKQDNVIELPVASVGKQAGKATTKFIESAKARPKDYGFKTQHELNAILSLTWYEMGSLVVKSEQYYLFIDIKGKIREREVAGTVPIHLINACGLRHFTSSSNATREKVLPEMFKTALYAAQEGIVVFPAVGMGVWRGDPAVYWKAFFDAVLDSEMPIQKILINPRHQITPQSSSKKYSGCNGSEFATILEERRKVHAQDPAKLAKLNKIVNLYESQQDVLQLAHELQQAFPHIKVSLLNASDPDVTLGYHVGEYTNNVPHTFTTEENYTRAGTNGICWEWLTGVFTPTDNPSRVIQATPS